MVSKTPVKHSIVFDSILSAADEACAGVLSELKTNNFSSDDIFAVHLALQEAFINAVKHGNKLNADKKIKIKYSVSADKIEIRVSDQGQGFEPENVKDPRCGENLLKTDGRGLFLIRSYMDEVRFNKRGNCMHIVKYKSKSCSKENKNFK